MTVIVNAGVNASWVISKCRLTQLYAVAIKLTTRTLRPQDQGHGLIVFRPRPKFWQYITTKVTGLSI